MRRWLLALLVLSLAVTAPALAQTRAPRARPRRGRTPTPPAVPAGPSPERIQAVTSAVHLSGVIPRCWNQYVRNAGDSAVSARFRVRVSVDDTGSVHEALVLDPTPEVLAGCVRTQLRGIHAPAGMSVTVQSTYSFPAGALAPVPVPPPPAEPDAASVVDATAP